MSIMSDLILVGGSAFFDSAPKLLLILNKNEQATIMQNIALKYLFFIVIAVFLTFFICYDLKALEVEQFNADLKNYNAKLIIFDDNNQKKSQFLVAIADNDTIRGYGLMNLDYLKPNYGMIFLFDESKIVEMWMKNTKISLDMIFINQNNQIVNIKTKAKPYSLDIISSKLPVDKVLEINAGLVDKLNIKIGQKIKIIY